MKLKDMNTDKLPILTKEMLNHMLHNFPKIAEIEVVLGDKLDKKIGLAVNLPKTITPEKLTQVVKFKSSEVGRGIEHHIGYDKTLILNDSEHNAFVEVQGPNKVDEDTDQYIIAFKYAVK